jgi:glycerate 2-kinase
MMIHPEKFLNQLFEAAVEAAMPQIGNMPLPQPVKGRTIVIGAGKAAASMAKVVEDNWQGDISGLVITRYKHGLDLKKIEIIEAGHPVPDNAGQQAAKDILNLVNNLSEEDQVICLISGGGSALLSLSADGVSLESKRQINKDLLACGADISEINTVRKKLSAIKGGRLAVAAWPAPLHSYVISDVPGDDLSVIASGPTVPDLTTVADAVSVLNKYEIELPDDIALHIENETAIPPKSDHPAFAKTSTHMIATPQISLEAAAKIAKIAGISPIILGDSIEGEARDVGRVMAGITAQVLSYGQPVKAPCVIISGGETTVTVTSNDQVSGRGGRNAEFLLSFAASAPVSDRVYALAADTDGIDGTEDNAGAIYLPSTRSRADAQNLSVPDYLKKHDAYTFFDKLDDLVKTGPTRTNVNDFRAILIL